jgi:hypothetical protein
MARATPSVPHSHLTRHLMTLARWLAQKAVKAQFKRRGIKVIDAKDLTETGNVHLVLHPELMTEAWEHPYTKQLRLQRRLSLARKAVIAEIRDKGRKVNSIAPQELRKLIETYLSEHPEENVVREIGCS